MIPRVFAAVIVCAAGMFVACNKSSNSTTGPNTNSLSGTVYFTEHTSGVTFSVFKLDLVSGAVTDVAYGEYPNAFPDKRILAVVDNNLDILSADGSQKQVVVQQNTGAPFNVIYDDAFFNPQRSNDGNFYAYDDNAIFPYTFVVDRNGALVQTFGDGKSNMYSRPTWGPDGTLYVQGAPNHNPGIFMIDKTFATITRIDPNLNAPTNPDASPDGSRIAFTMNSHIWVMNSDGSGVRQITTGSGAEDYAVWSPDGKWLAVYGQGCNITAVEVDGSGIVPLVSTYSAMANLCPQQDGQMDWK